MSEPNTNKSTKQPNSSPSPKKLPTIAVIGIGCFILLFVAGVILTIAGKALFSSIGNKFINQGLEKVVEENSGINIDKNGEAISFKDKKTGAEISVGSDKMPENFPSDFPLYPGAKPTGNLTGSGETDNQSIWLLMETQDQYDTVIAFYREKLKPSGWTQEEPTSLGNSISWKLNKGNMDGALVVGGGEEDAKKTTILITLSQKKAQ